ncbi:uncharacterized protein SPPG_07802 [Spizellomyces punctatus DAOM BR117]|uniref:Protein BIG1 n=1 Tax=Spizellomyces punctatus (strain DAOM BR117) TaxID=645134 RepID=A0A0L0H649_SPIPD|nr:uncharacterized protein SPPG_07802 [Spizellomyces punctatus DAOM BR117]KNC96985.1 hypothetical protein SPPG_07802 [Spizellomyces punctatus DAOM BR117]|eukprot:XP_016605025.1 hypothetical protein SPPG_07802 [Spizellomyces punctatus DAOM BR117]
MASETIPARFGHIRRYFALFLLLTVIIGVSAYEDTVPLILWSGKKFSVPSTSSILRRSDLSPVFGNVGCRKLNVVFEQKDLHALDLPHLSPATKKLKRSVDSAPSSLKISFVAAANDVKDVVEHIQDACQKAGQEAVVLKIGEDGSVPDLSDGKSYILVASLKPLRAASAAEHVETMTENDNVIDKVLTDITKLEQDDWTAVFTGVSNPSTLRKRATQATPLPWSKRPIFQKYVFFNQGLFMCIFAMVPLVIIGLLGVRIISSIQTPTRYETKKKEK